MSPLIALQVSAGIERSRDAENKRRDVLEVLMATRHAQLGDDRIRALNKITVLFAGESKVIAAHRALMEALSKPMNPDGSMPDGLANTWNERQWDLVAAIAQTLRIPITHDEFVLGYAPRAIGDAMAQQNLLVETNKSLLSFARKELGLRWDPNFLYKLPPGAGIVGSFSEAGPPEEPKA